MRVKKKLSESMKKSFAIAIAFLIAFTTVNGNLQSYAASNDLNVEFKERLSEDGQSVHLDIYVKEESDVTLLDIILPDGIHRTKDEMKKDEKHEQLYTTVELTENQKYDFEFNYTKTTVINDKKEDVGGVLKSSYEVKTITKQETIEAVNMEMAPRAAIPNPRQTIKGPDGTTGSDIVLNQLTGEVTFTIKQFIASDGNHPWKNFGLKTTLPKEVEYLDMQITDETGYNLDEEFEFAGNISNKNMVEVNVNNDFFLGSPDFEGHEIVFTLRAQLAKNLDPTKSLTFKNDAIINANGASYSANTATATYTVETPEEPVADPNKTVSDANEVDVVNNTIDDRSEVITYKVKQAVPTSSNWSDFIFNDEISSNYDIQSVKVLQDGSTDVSSKFSISKDNNKVLASTNKDFLKSDAFYKHTYTLEVKVKIKDTLEITKPLIITNEATMTRNGDVKNTNKTTSTFTPVEVPIVDPTKSVSDSDEANVLSNTIESRNEEITYKVNQEVPASSNWKDLVFSDQVSSNYDIQSVKVLQDGSTDVSSKFTISKANNKVQASANKEFLNTDAFYKHSYTLEIKVKIKENLDISKPLSIANEATLTRNGGVKKTNETTSVYTPPVKVTIGSQTVSDVNESDKTIVTLDSRSETIKFKTVQQVPSYHVDQVWTQFLFTDVLHESLAMSKVSIKDNEGNDVTSKFKDDSIGQNIILKATTDFVASKEFYGKTYTFEIEANIKEAYPIKQAITIENTVIMGLDKEMKDTNKVSVKYTPSAIVIADPTKTVSDSDESLKIENTLQSRNEKITYRISQKTSKYSAGQTWESFIIKDSVANFLNVESVKVFNGKNEDVTSSFKDESTENVVNLIAKDEILETKEFYDQTYTIEIVASIKEAYEIENQLVFTNQASVVVNGGAKETNRVTTTFTPHGNPDKPTKSVSDERVTNVDSNHLESKDEEFIYRINQSIPAYHQDKVWKSFELEDTISDSLQIQSIKVKDATGKDVSNKFTNKTNANNVSLVANVDWLKEKAFYGTSYTFEVTVKIKDGSTLTSDLTMENKAKLLLDGDVKETNTVTTTYSISENIASPTKRVSDKDETLVTSNTLQSRNEELVYTLTQKVPEFHVDSVWQSFVIEDGIQSFLLLDNYKIVDEEGTDVSSQFKNESSENFLKFVAKDEFLASESFYGHTYTIELTTKLKSDFNLTENITFENKASTTINGKKRTTNSVNTTYVAVPTIEVPTKSISDRNETKVTTNTLDSVLEEMTYHITQVVPYYHEDKVYDVFKLSDSLNEALEFKGFKVTQDGNDVSDKFTKSITNQNVELIADTAWIASEEFYDHSYEFELNVTVKENAELTGQATIKNIATVVIDDENLSTNEVSTNYTAPVELPIPTKNIVLENGTKVKSTTLDSKKQIVTFEVSQTINSYHEDAKLTKFVFEDSISEELAIVDYKIMQGNKDVTASFNDETSVQDIKLSAKESLVTGENFYNNTYVLVINTKLKDETTEEVSISNKAKVTTNDISTDTNEVSVTYVAPVKSGDPKKTVSDKDELDVLANELTSKNEGFTYKITQEIATYHKDSELSKFEVIDELNNNLNVVSVKIVDENNKDVSSKFTKDTKDGIVKVAAKDKQLKDKSFYGHTYTMIIDVKVKEESQIEETTIIKNTASVNLGAVEKKTNEVATTYHGMKQELTNPTKKIMQNNTLVETSELASRTDKIQYVIQQSIPEYHVDHVWNNFEISDNISGALDIVSVKVVNDNNEDVSDQFTQTVGKELKLAANAEWLKTPEFYNTTYKVIIETRLKDSIGIASYNPEDVVIKNTATTIQNGYESKTNEVKTTYRPATIATVPTELIGTKASAGLEVALNSREDVFTYHVTQQVPRYHVDQIWKNFIFNSNIHNDVEVDSFKVLDEEGNDVSNQFSSDFNTQNISVKANPSLLQTKEFYGHTYTLELNVKLKDSAALGDHIRLENQFSVTRNQADAKTNKVFVSYTAPALLKAPTLSVSDDDEVNVIENTFETRQELTYRINQNVGAYHIDGEWKTFEINNNLPKEVSIKNIRVIDQSGNDVSENFDIETNENDVRVIAHDSWIESKEFYNNTYIVEIKTELVDTPMSEGANFKNVASVSVNGVTVNTNEVNSIYTPLKSGYAKPTKTIKLNGVESSDTLTLSKEDTKFTYVIRQKVNPYDIDSLWTSFEIKDSINKELKVNSVKIFDETDKDVTENFINNSSNNEINYSATKELLNTKEFYSHVYRMEIEVEVKDLSKLITKTTSNTATVIRGNGEAAKTNEVSFIYKLINTSVNLCAHKELQGANLKDGEFEFILEAEDGTVYKARNKADGSIDFESITFVEEGVYNFKMYESKGTNAGIVYDDTVFNITIKVVKSSDGSQLVALVTYLRGEEQNNTFINTLKDEPIDPTDPVEPTKPIDPTKPTELVKPKEETNSKSDGSKTINTGVSNNTKLIFTTLLAISASGIVFGLKKKKESND